MGEGGSGGGAPFLSGLYFIVCGGNNSLYQVELKSHWFLLVHMYHPHLS